MARRQRSGIQKLGFFILGLVWLVVAVGVGTVAIPYASNNPVYFSAVRLDAQSNAEWHSEYARVVRAGAAFSDEGTVELPAQLRYRNFGGQMRTSHRYMLPGSDSNGSLEPVVVSKNGSLWVVNDMQSTFYSPYSRDGELLTEFFGWVAASIVSVVAAFIAWGVLRLVAKLGGKIMRAGGSISIRSLSGLLIRRLLLGIRVAWDFLSRQTQLLARRLQRKPTTVYYRRLRRIQQIYQRMDRNKQVKRALKRVAAAIEVVLVRDQGGQVAELDEQVRALVADMLPEVMARELVQQERAPH